MNGLGTTYSGSTASVDLRTMKSNLEFLKRRSEVPDVLAVVKADAYGHGAVAVARSLEGSVTGFAVASVDEGIQLREAGIRKPVLVFGVPTKQGSEAIAAYRLTATVSRPGHLRLLPPGCDYHVNFDTGMRRLGLFERETGELLEAISHHSGLECTGIYSHYAAADEPGSEFVHLQHERFRQIRSMLSLDLPFHMSNTGAVSHYRIDHFDIIRVGIGLAGYTPGKTQVPELRPALEWTTELAQIRRISKGDAVSYGGNWRAPSDGYLGTLPVGYADGVPRALGKRLEVGIGDKSYPVVGNITMDYCMVFLGDRKAGEGETVHLMGSRGLRANEWADRSGSITHEILCRLTPRVRRRYRE